MKEGNAIEVRDVTKKFKVFLDKGHTLKEVALFRNRRKYQEREVLKGISFDVKKGEAVGLIGQNGCGKSTTLKLLTRIMYPDAGTIEMKGRISSLIELGAGFHPDMSGRQNIYTNASIFGLTRKEIEKRMNDIIAFSELHEFIDNPVRTYSSGMYMRLAFAVAINVDADILLIDEILAVGDAAFQAKCFNRLREIKAAGTTIVIVSHSMGQIEQICDQAIWIKDGKIEEQGSPRTVIQTYMAWIMEGDKFSPTSETEQKNENHKTSREKPEDKDNSDIYEYTLTDVLELKKSGKCVEIGNRDVEIVDYEVLDANTRKNKDRFAIGESILCKIFYKRNNSSVKDTMCSLSIYRDDGLICYATNSFINRGENFDLQDTGMIELLIKDSPFMQGNYIMDFSLNKDYGPVYHGYLNACRFMVYNVMTDYGVCRPQIEWKIDSGMDVIISADNNIGKDNYKEALGIKRILELTSVELIPELSPNKEYDLIIISDMVYDLYQKNQLISKALEVAHYILIKDAAVYNVTDKIKNCYLFEEDKKPELLIPVSTKNKQIFLEIINELENKKKVNRWLLESFKNGELSFELAQDQNRTMINLQNRLSETIVFLDEGIAFGYNVVSEKKHEGPRTNIRERAYPGNNLYELLVEEKPGSKIEVSIVKEGEYWLNDFLPECIATIEVV